MDNEESLKECYCCGNECDVSDMHLIDNEWYCEDCIKLDKAIIKLSQILSMVNTSIELTFNDFDMLFRNEQQELKGLFNFTTGESISIDNSRVIMFNDSGALVVYSGDTLGEVVAGNSDIAIKLYEDLLVGYKKNNKAAVCYSSLFTKYIRIVTGKQIGRAHV